MNRAGNFFSTPSGLAPSAESFSFDVTLKPGEKKSFKHGLGADNLALAGWMSPVDKDGKPTAIALLDSPKNQSVEIAPYIAGIDAEGLFFVKNEAKDVQRFKGKVFRV